MSHTPQKLLSSLSESESSEVSSATPRDGYFTISEADNATPKAYSEFLLYLINNLSSLIFL